MTRRHRGKGSHRQEGDVAHVNAVSSNAGGNMPDQRRGDPSPVSASSDNTNMNVHAATHTQTHDTTGTGVGALATTTNERSGSSARRRRRPRDRRHGKTAGSAHRSNDKGDAAPVVACGNNNNNNNNSNAVTAPNSKASDTTIHSNTNKQPAATNGNKQNNGTNAAATNSTSHSASVTNSAYNDNTNNRHGMPAHQGRRRVAHNACPASAAMPAAAAAAAAAASHMNGYGECGVSGPNRAYHTGTAMSSNNTTATTVYPLHNNYTHPTNAYTRGAGYGPPLQAPLSAATSAAPPSSLGSPYAQGQREERAANPPLPVSNSDNYAKWVNKDFMAIIKAFVSSDESTELVFPASLTPTQRSTVHRLASTFKLTHKSYGSGAQRALKLTKEGYHATRGGAGRDKNNANRTPNDVNHTPGEVQPFAKTYSGFQGAQLLMTPYLTHSIVTATMAKLLPLKKIILRHLRSQAAHPHRRRMRVAEPALTYIPAASADVLARYASLEEFRQTLPAYRAGAAVVSAVRRSPIVIISGATGCGKTTQIPQMLYDAGIFDPNMHIICTQPRRISALSIAQRVAEERGEACGNRCGYIIRFENVTSSQTRIIYVTTGILLRRLHTDPDLTGISCVVVDEVHERDVETDFCLLLLRDRLRAQRRNPAAFATLLKVVVMSATVQIEPLLRYFADCGGVDVAHPNATTTTYSGTTQTCIMNNNMNITTTTTTTTTTSNKNKNGNEGRPSLSTDASSASEPPLISIEGTLFPVEEYFLEEALALTGTTASSVAAVRLKVPNARTPNAPITLDQDKGECESTAGNGMDNDEGGAGGGGGSAPTFFDKLKTSVANTVDPNAEAMIPYELIVRLITHIHQSHMRDLSGSILVFLPGWSAIQGVSDRLRRSPIAAQLSVFLLHSSLTSAEQQRVFQPPPRRYRKVVLSTNLAETSVTINDIVYVIDSGLYKGNHYDANSNTSSLQATMIARANGQQRRGRAGRCRPGVCYHLLPRAVYAALPDFLPPAMMSSALEEVCLQIKAVHPGERCAAVLQRALDPPPSASVQHAVQFLTDMGALSEYDEALTHLGRALAQLPTHPQLGKMLFAAACLGVLAPIATIAAALSIRSIFVKPQPFERAAAKDTARRLDDGDWSDHLCALKVYNAWLRAGRSVSVATQYRADPTRLRALDKTRGQLERLVYQSALVRRLPDARWRLSCFAHHTALVKLVLLWSLYPRLATMDYRRYRDVNKPQVVCWDDKHAVVSAGSVLDGCKKKDLGDRSVMMYYDRMYLEATLNVFDCTAMTPADVLLCVREVTVRPLRELPRDWILDEASTIVPRLPFDVALLDEAAREETSRDDGGGEGEGEGEEEEGRASNWMAMIMDKDKRMYVTRWQVAILLSLARECMNYYLALCIKQLRADAFPVPLIFLLCDVMGYPVAADEQEAIRRRVREGPPRDGSGLTEQQQMMRMRMGGGGGAAESDGDGDAGDEDEMDTTPVPDFVRAFHARPGEDRMGDRGDDDACDEEGEVLMEEVTEAFTIELTAQERMQVRDALGDLVLFQSEGVGAKVAAAYTHAHAQSAAPLSAQPLASHDTAHEEGEDGVTEAPSSAVAPTQPCCDPPVWVGGGRDGAAEPCVCSDEDEDEEDEVVMEAGILNIVE